MLTGRGVPRPVGPSMLLTSLLLLPALLAFQEPDAALRRDLDSRDPGARRSAAVSVAALGPQAEDWLLHEVGKGSPARRRALLAAATLLGTPDSLEALEKAAKPGSRPDEVRAFALLFFGAHHPAAAERAEELWDRLPTDFERSCLLVGLLSRARELEGQGELSLGRKPDPRLRALVRVLQSLQGGKPAADPADLAEATAAALVSVLPGGSPLPEEAALLLEEGGLPEWVLGARRAAPTTPAALRSALLGGHPAVVLGLARVEAAEAAAAFAELDARVTEPAGRSWLWGVAGDLGLDLHARKGDLSDAEVAGLLRLARRDPARAASTAEAWRDRARDRWKAEPSAAASWPAAVVLGLAPEAEDLELLRGAVAASSAADAQRLHPIWQFASGRTSSEESRRRWLSTWSRELGAGHLGFLDREGPRWAAYLLVSGTRTAEERAELSVPIEAFAWKKDHARDSEVYADLAEWLLAGHFRWDLD